jgi:hypothetical protein
LISIVPLLTRIKQWAIPANRRAVVDEGENGADWRSVPQRGRMKPKAYICTLNIWAGRESDQRARIDPTYRRLTGGVSRLKNIDPVRNHRQDPLFDHAAENRIVWRELLELELQDMDEQMERIVASTSMLRR